MTAGGLHSVGAEGMHMGVRPVHCWQPNSWQTERSIKEEAQATVSPPGRQAVGGDSSRPRHEANLVTPGRQ